MIIYRTKHKGILSEFAFLEDSKPNHAIILCEGLPTVPKRQETIEYLAKQGFLVFYPRFRGTWESDGEFLVQKPVDDIRDIIELIKSGNVQELFNLKTFSFDIQRISVLGASFGGAIALTSSSLPDVHKVVALSPVVDFKLFNTKYPEQDLKQVGEFMLRAFTNGYRFTAQNWVRLLNGEIINPTESLNQGGTEKVLIIQCVDDSTVNHISVGEFAKQFNINYKLLQIGGHFSFSKVSKELWSELEKWIND